MNEDKIRKYLDEELSGSELENFEQEIKNSPSLKREIESFKMTISNFKELEKVETKGKYFINILPRFHENLAKPKKFSLRPSFATGGVIVLVALFLFVLNRIPEGINKDQLTLQQINIEDLNDYYGDYTKDISTTHLLEEVPEGYDSLLNIIMENELNLDDYSQGYIVDVSNNELNNIIDELSEEEVDGIYNSIIKKNFN